MRRTARKEKQRHRKKKSNNDYKYQNSNNMNDYNNINKLRKAIIQSRVLAAARTAVAAAALTLGIGSALTGCSDEDTIAQDSQSGNLHIGNIAINANVTSPLAGTRGTVAERDPNEVITDFQEGDKITITYNFSNTTDETYRADATRTASGWAISTSDKEDYMMLPYCLRPNQLGDSGESWANFKLVTATATIGKSRDHLILSSVTTPFTIDTNKSSATFGQLSFKMEHSGALLTLKNSDVVMDYPTEHFNIIKAIKANYTDYQGEEKTISFTPFNDLNAVISEIGTTAADHWQGIISTDLTDHGTIVGQLTSLTLTLVNIDKPSDTRELTVPVANNVSLTGNYKYPMSLSLSQTEQSLSITILDYPGWNTEEVITTDPFGDIYLKDNAYCITSALGMKAFANLVNGTREMPTGLRSTNVTEADFTTTAKPSINGKVMNDIDLSSVCGDGTNGSANANWTPIGTGENPFTGKFLAGATKTISNLYINNSNVHYQGLFGVIGENGWVYIPMVKSNGVTGNVYVGIIAGKNMGTIIASGTSGDVSGGNFVGGLVGYNSGMIYSSFTTGIAIGANETGALVGFNINSGTGTVSNCLYLQDKGTNGIGINAGTATAEKVADITAMNEAGNIGYLNNGIYNYNAANPDIILDMHFVAGSPGDVVPPVLASGKPTELYVLDIALNNSTYEIYTARGMKAFAALVNGAAMPTGTNIKGFEASVFGTKHPTINGTLSKDIDLSTVCGTSLGNWTAIGDYNNRYQGSFEGGGYTVSNLYINDTGLSRQGFFGYIDEAGKVQNLTVAGVTSGDAVTANFNAGILAGQNDGTINCCSASGNVKVTATTGGYGAGGLVGESYGTIMASHATGNVSGGGNLCLGGLVGTNSYKSCVIASYATGDITGGSDSENGGLVGRMDYGCNIIASYATGVSSSSNNSTGGLLGNNNGSDTQYCLSVQEKGSIKKNTNHNGVTYTGIGYSGSGTITYCHGGLATTVINAAGAMNGDEVTTVGYSLMNKGIEVWNSTHASGTAQFCPYAWKAGTTTPVTYEAYKDGSTTLPDWSTGGSISKYRKQFNTKNR